MREEKKANNNEIIDYVVGYGIEETVSNVIENILQNADEIMADFTQKAIVALGISYPTLSGQKILYPFKDTLIGANKVAENVVKLFGNNASLLAKAGASALIGTIVSSAINIANGQDWTEAVPEAIVKSVPMAILVTGLSMYNVPSFAIISLGFATSLGIDWFYDRNAFGIKSVTESISAVLKNIDGLIVKNSEIIFE